MFIWLTYPEIGDANLKCVLGTFKQQLTLKMRTCCRISIFSYKRLCTVSFGISFLSCCTLKEFLIVFEVTKSSDKVLRW